MLQTSGGRRNKSSDKSNQTWSALSTRDKVSQRLTANAAMTDSVEAVQTIKMLILESSTVEIPQAIPLSHETWDNYCFLFLSLLLFHQTAECVKFRHIFRSSKVTSSQTTRDTFQNNSFGFGSPLTSCLSFRMNGQKQWTRVAVMALLVLTVMAAEGGKAEKQGESWGAQDRFFISGKIYTTNLSLQVQIYFILQIHVKQERRAVQFETKSTLTCRH